MPEIVCPRCLEAKPVRIDVATGKTLTCDGCEEEYTVEQVETLLACWSAVLPRLKAFAVVN